MPDWCFDILTAAQADEDRTTKIWRWKVLVGALDLPGVTKATALWLAHYCKSEQEWCWPATTTLAAESGFGRKAVERAIKILEGHGLVYVQRQPFERDKRRKSSVYALAWPETRPVGAAGELCGMPGRRGEPCQRVAAWGVPGAVDGPCRYHRDEMSAREASMSASKASTVGTRCQQMSALDDRKGTSPSEGSSCEGTRERLRSLKNDERRRVDDLNDEGQRHAYLLAVLQDQKRRSEGLTDWQEEFDTLLELESVRAGRS